MFPFLIWAFFGAFIGWLSSLVIHVGGRYGALGNIAAGTMGAALGGFLFNRSVAADIVSVGSVLTALSGAAILLALVNLFMTERAP